MTTDAAPIGMPLAQELDRALANCSRQANASHRRQYLAVCLPVAGRCDPLQLFGLSSETHRYYWEHPSQDFALAALGRTWSLQESAVPSEDRFAMASAAARQVFAATTVVSPANAGDGPGNLSAAQRGPLLVGGFSFSAEHDNQGEWRHFPAAQLVLPQQLLVCAGGHTVLTVCLSVDPGDDIGGLGQQLRERLQQAQHRVSQAASGNDPTGAPSPLFAQPPFTSGAEYRVVADREHAIYRRQVVDALRAIAAGQLEKVVLARSLRVEHPGSFAIPAFIDRLRLLYPDCVSFACASASDAFIAASPERLVGLTAGRVLTGALAGSAARGQTPEEDAALAGRLHASAKERAEHDAVLRTIRGALGEVCWSLQGPEEPQLMRLAGIQHLYTPLRGRLRPGDSTTDIIDLVRRLHPTPAVGGLPARDALQWIDRKEGLQRGWFGGPVGYIDGDGGGEFRVALRSGLIRNPDAGERRDFAMARLFAGAGIVRGSAPERELRETRLKLRALLAPLTEI